MGSFEARGSSASKLPMPLGLACGTFNLTVLDDEFLMATIGQVAGM
jgi:hypothetical protein